ncbi:methyltransferase domain-containing protein [Nonomuraea sp. NPDC049269]|uniref:methyltransferase domain-containing protein n=1 Tax=Nonomuraea sp. NPDC049269 TaxID=3364349 RepID=UPI00371D9839
MDDDTIQRIERLIDHADVCGDIGQPVKAAIRAVPRHLFIPAVALAAADEDEPFIIDRDADPGRWWETVYSKHSIVTQLDDGKTDIRAASRQYTSSSSAPSTVAHLLELLDPDPGNRILEIGTGTGWTAALLSHLVGEQGSVTSIEVDAAVAERAAKNLAAAGVQPRLITGDGADGLPDGGPYDRVHVTCGIHTVPYAWVEQSRPSAVIVAPYCPGFGTDHALRLVVGPDGTATGRFPGFASYMMMRSQRPAELSDVDPATAREFQTRIDPRAIAHAPAGADLAISALTGLRSATYRRDDFFRMWVIGGSDQWAAATWEPKREEYEAFQIGDRAVWQEAVDAYFQWVSWGEPGRDRFGMTVTPEGQRIWLDTPERVVG